MSSRRDLANAIRALTMDAVQKAKSGHPGAPMGMADIAEVLWRNYLNHNPANPQWSDHDRFVLSNGHGSMLLYSLLHLSGYDLSIEDIKNFRQLHSKTAGHPEYGYAPGIETTTGPLGQGIANGVGMAIAEKTLATQFNREGHEIVNHNTYVFMGDGCMMEGISHEVCSLAGTLELGKLIVFYDDNGISIDGAVAGWFTDDTVKRFESYSWHVVPAVDGHNPAAICAAIEEGLTEKTKPTLICCKTVIGCGSPNKEGKKECHGAPLGDEEIKLTRERLGWQHNAFEIPAAIYAEWNAKEAGATKEVIWNKKFAAYQASYPALAKEYVRRLKGELPVAFSEKATAYIKSCQEEGKKISSRQASQNTLNAYGPVLPELFGGAADLSSSTLSLWNGAKNIQSGDIDSSNYVFYGVREFGMSAMMNGIALHGGFIPYGATFLVFMEYACHAVRMASLMKQRAIFIYTHDSIGLGEDGPTHQPIEQISSLRMTPNMNVWRPCDTAESAVAWRCSIERKDGPSALIFSRQCLPCMYREDHQVANISRGGYVLKDCNGIPELILIATGSEVELAVNAEVNLTEQGCKVRVISMPSTDVFDVQDVGYKQSVLPVEVPARIAIEAAAVDFWYKYVGLNGRVIGMTTFGKSAPAVDLFQYFGFTVEKIVSEAKDILN